VQSGHIVLAATPGNNVVMAHVAPDPVALLHCLTSRAVIGKGFSRNADALF
jgi:hypothetical protein